MRKIKARRKNISRCTPHKKSLQLPIRQPRQNKNAIQPLQPQLVPEEIPQRVRGWQRLAAQAQRINQIAAELEHAILELKAIANELNCDRRSVDKTHTQSSCEYLKATVPCVRRKKAGAFVLTTRQVDLFRAEREATQLANRLRSLAKKRRKVVSTSSQRNKRCVIIGGN